MSEATSRLLGARVSQLRQQQGMTLEQLASASGVSRSMLSQIERGGANPTLAVTQRIAQTFGISIGELVDDPNASSPIDVVRGDDPATLFRADGECELRTLSPLHQEKNIEFYAIRLQPGAALTVRMSSIASPATWKPRSRTSNVHCRHAGRRARSMRACSRQWRWPRP